ncbi:MAG: RDD family protein [Rhodobacteraceae bacterium]|nr:RDD family protein [Paracoccaceae bacterium]
MDRTLPDLSGLPDPDFQAEFYAGVPTRRLLAFVIDALATAALALVALPFTAFIGLFFLPVLVLLVGILYRWATISLGSATPGMRLLAIEFRDGAGQRLDSGRALAHTLLFALACAITPLQLLSAALMATSARGQGLGDRLLGTTAIRRAAPG